MENVHSSVNGGRLEQTTARENGRRADASARTKNGAFSAI